MSQPEQDQPNTEVRLGGFTQPLEKFDFGETVVDTSRLFFKGLSLFCKVIIHAPFGPAVPQGPQQPNDAELASQLPSHHYVA